MLSKYISISDSMLTNLLNIIIETIDEYNLFVFDKALKFRFFEESVLNDAEVQDQFVEIIKDRLSNKDKFYIIEKFKEYKISKFIQKGIERRENNEINESSTIKYFVEKLESFLLLKHAQNLVVSVKTADQNMSLGLLDEKDLKIIKDNMFSLLNDLTFEADFGEMEINDLAKRERDKLLINTHKVIPTFLPRLNEILSGGAYPNKLYFIAAPPGFGKSIFLNNIGLAALKQGKNVYHITCEMGCTEVMSRYDCLISGHPMIDIIGSPIEVIGSYVRNFMNEHPESYLVVKEWPPGVLTKDMLSLYIRRKIISSGKKPDLIIVDYADIMKSSIKNTERRSDLGTIYTQLKALSSEFQCPVWTASQINREGFKKTESDMSNLAESWEKAMIADLVLVVRQSPEELQRNKLRLYIAKFRSGESRKEIRCNCNYKYMKMEEDDEVEVNDFSEIDFGSKDKPQILNTDKNEEKDELFGI